MVKSNYKTSDIQQMDPLEQIRLRPGMYIGNSENPTKLLIECLDNAIDEVENGHADKILVAINNKTGQFIVADSGRGIPFDYKLPEEKDPPILICNSIFTSGKYKKNSEDSAYSVAAGLHGVGLTCVNALSEYMKIDVFKNGKRASYEFKYKKPPVRNPIVNNVESKFSTVFTVQPHKDHFDSLKINETIVRERLIIAASNFNKLNIALKIDDKLEYIKGSENNLIEQYLGKNVKEWYEFESNNKNKEKKNEHCTIKIGWDLNNQSTKMETFTTVNFVKVDSGYHITKITNIIEDVFQQIAKKKGFEFNSADALNWIRIYINLKIVNVEFEGQTKERLSKRSDLTVMDDLEKSISNYFKKLENINDLLERFEYYRQSLNTKNTQTGNTKSKKRGIAGFHNLRDCNKDGGELIICEGKSAESGFIKMRDPSKHAILPLRGVVINVMSSTLAKVLKNDISQDIIKSIGCGILNNCNIKNLRYKKIIITTDADDAGDFISALLITFFAKLTPDIIQNENLFLCKTPLFGYGVNKNFTPIWTDEEYKNIRENTKHKIRRFKGLGQFNNEEIYKIALDEKTRQLIKVEWDPDICVKLFELMSSSKYKKDLTDGNYEY